MLKGHVSACGTELLKSVVLNGVHTQRIPCRGFAQVKR